MDPWISLDDHHTLPITVIYGGEGGSSHMHEYLLNHNGTDVYIRWKMEAKSLLKYIRNKFNRNINNSNKFSFYLSINL